MHVLSTALLLAATCFLARPAAAQILSTGEVLTFLEMGTDRQAPLPGGMSVVLNPYGGVGPVIPSPCYVAECPPEPIAATQYRAGAYMHENAPPGLYNLGASDSLHSGARALGIKFGDFGRSVYGQAQLYWAAVYIPVRNTTGAPLKRVVLGFDLGTFLCRFWRASINWRLYASWDGIGFDELENGGWLQDPGNGCAEDAWGGVPNPSTTGGGWVGEYEMPPNIAAGDTFYVALAVSASDPRESPVFALSSFWIAPSLESVEPRFLSSTLERDMAGVTVGATGTTDLGLQRVLGKTTRLEPTASFTGPHAGEFTASYSSLTQTTALRWPEFRASVSFAPKGSGVREAYLTLSAGETASDSIHLRGVGFDTLFANTLGSALLDSLRASYSPETVYAYADAIDTLFLRADGDPASVTGIYTGYRVEIPLGANPTEAACNGDGDYDPSTCTGDRTITIDHVWPRQLGSDSGWPEADMHHLYPSRSDVIHDRGSLPLGDAEFGGIFWFWSDRTLRYTQPRTNPGTWSTIGEHVFEPRDQVKGDIARALFYFRTIYAAEATASADRITFFDSMKETLLAWHRADPPSVEEVLRSERIAMHQGNVNPFTIDTSLVARAYFSFGTSVEEVPVAERALRVYPSPAHTFVVIEGHGRTALYDMLGRQVHQVEVDGETLLDVSALAPGVYFVRSEGRMSSFIKQ